MPPKIEKVILFQGSIEGRRIIRLVITGNRNTGITVCRQLGLEQTDCASTKLDLLPTPLLRVEHQVRLEVKIGFGGNFGVKQSPLNTDLSPPCRADVPICK